MAEININYTSDALQEGGNNPIINVDNNTIYTTIATIPFTESKINKNDWTTKVYTHNNYNYGLMIKKDPIIIESNSLLIENTPVLYSYNNNLERVNGVHSNYSTKFFVYPCIDLYYINNDVFTTETLKQFAGIDNNYNFNTIRKLYNNYNNLSTSGSIPEYGLHNIVGGLECINTKDDSYAAYNIDINNLGINLPSDADRGMNEDTLQLFDINNTIHYLDQRLINKKVTVGSYYYGINKLLAIHGLVESVSYNRDERTVRLKTAIRYLINYWDKHSNINDKEKCMNYAFDNIISTNSYTSDADRNSIANVSYNIILMGVKKVEEV